MATSKRTSGIVIGMAIIIGIGIDLGILVLTLVLVFEARAQVQKMLTMNGYCRLSLHIMRSISAQHQGGQDFSSGF